MVYIIYNTRLVYSLINTTLAVYLQYYIYITCHLESRIYWLYIGSLLYYIYITHVIPWKAVLYNAYIYIYVTEFAKRNHFGAM